MEGLELFTRGHSFIKDDEGRDALRVDYEFVNKRETGVPTEKASDKATQNGVELEHGTVDGDDGSFPFPLRNGGGTMCWAIYVLQDKSPVTVTFTNIDQGANEVFITETYEVE